MNITEVRVKMVSDGTERLRAFCSVTLDDAFVIRDLKVIDGTDGPFVAMPSRKLSDRCHKCGNKNHLRARFCNECGGKLNENRAPRDSQSRVKLHADVAHPINATCRERIQAAVIEAFTEELDRLKQPDYKPRALDADDEDFGDGFDTGLDEGDSEGTSDYNQLIAELKESVKKKNGRGGRRPSDRRGHDHRESRGQADRAGDGARQPAPIPVPDPPPAAPVPKEPPAAETDEDGFTAGIF
ncbi:MAG: septation protein SpoVG family protein [Phycisphaerae bacterium]